MSQKIIHTLYMIIHVSEVPLTFKRLKNGKFTGDVNPLEVTFLN